VGAGTFELKIHFGPGYRVYFGKDGERIVVLLAGGTKQRQQIDIQRRPESIFSATLSRSTFIRRNFSRV
jgi:putative addiction module killer protein